MGSQSGRPAQLGADNVIRFLDADHFLRELAGNLGRGRAFVRTRRDFELQTSIQLEIEAPGIPWKVDADAVVVFSRDGFVGLEFEDFEAVVLPKLDRLGQEAEEAKALPAERTVIAPIPTFGTDAGEASRVGAAEVHITEEEEVTGSSMHMRPLPPAAPEEPQRKARDRNTTVVQEAPPVLGATLADEDLPAEGQLEEEDPVEDDGTQDLRLYERSVRKRRLRSSSSTAPISAADDADAQERAGARDDLATFDAPMPRLLVDPAEQPPAPLAEVVAEPAKDPVGDPVLEPAPSQVTEETPVADPPAPSIPAMGLEVFQDRKRRFARATAGGVLKLGGEGDLIGLYLSQIRHGLLTVIGGPEGEVGETATLKIAMGRVVTIEAEILARVGDWLTLAIPDPAPVAELLREAKDALKSLFEEIAGEPLVTTAPEPEVGLEPAPAPEPKLEPEPAPEPEQRPAPEPEPESTAPEEKEDAPRVPKLEGDTVAFERPRDVAHEISANLQNGGLFVESSPLPLRAKKRLTVSIGGRPTGVGLDAEVVFANDGRVGFMVSNAHDALPKLQKIVETGDIPEHDGEGSTLDLDAHQISSAQQRDDAGPIKGRIEPPLTMGRILEFQSRRIDETDLTQTTLLQIFDYLVREGWRGVLDVQSEDRTLSIWMHEGSVAFVARKPLEESMALGRILINMKRLNDAGLRQGLETGSQTKKSLGRTLVALGLIKKSDLSAALREQSRLILDEAFDWKGGRYEWNKWREPPGEADLILTKGIGIMSRHLRRRYEALGSTEVEVLFGKNMGRRVARNDEIDRVAGPLQLQPKELRFIQLQLDGTRPISDAVLGSPIGRLASLRLVGVLLSLGQLQFTDGNQEVVREATAIRREPSAFVRVKKELKERLALLRDMNHFEVLGVHWSSHHRGHRAAYEKIRREFDLKRPPLAGAPDDVKSLAKELNGIIDAAWATLSDADKRKSYRKQLFDRTEREYAADMLVKQGEVALMRGDRVSAIEALETAVELEPSQRNRQLLATAREGRR